jgi:hypothetical protein
MIANGFKKIEIHENDFQFSFTFQAVTRPLFVHYILGQYFTNASNGPDQLQWLLGDEKMTGLSMSGAVSKSIR